MKVQHANYQENKKIALEMLDEYYERKYGKFEIDPASRDYEKELTEHVSMILIDEDKIIGRIFGYIDRLTFSIRIDGLIIDSTARKAGAGRILVSAFENYGKQEKCQISFVDTTSSSAPKFYEKIGYSIIGEISDYPMPGETYYFYMKRL